MRLHIFVTFAVCLTLQAEEKLASLKVGSEVYSNLTITKVTATDVFFMHARGVGNAKLKDLDPESQKHFRYDPAKASEAAKQQAEASAQYHQEVAATKPPLVKPAEVETEPAPLKLTSKCRRLTRARFLASLHQALPSRSGLPKRLIRPANMCWLIFGRRGAARAASRSLT